MCYHIAILISHHALVMSTKRQAGNICLLLILNCLKTYIFELEKNRDVAAFYCKQLGNCVFTFTSAEVMF